MASLIHEPQRPRKPWRVDWWERGRSRTLRFASKREAEMFIGDLARGARGADATMTLIEWVPGWIKTRGLEWERRTHRDRANEMDRLILPWLGKERIGELTRRQIREWRAALIADGVTTYAAQHAVKTLSTCLGAAVDDDLIPANPCAGLRALQWTKRPQDPATIDDVEAIRARMITARDRATVSLMAYAGLRPGEVTALQWSDVRAETIVVRRGAGRATGQTKTGSVRSVPIIPVLRDDLEALPGRREGTVLAIKQWSHWARDAWRPAREAAGVAYAPKVLRHTAASLWIAEGIDIQQVAHRLGHSSTRLVHDTYGHLFHEAQLSSKRPDVQTAASVARRKAERHATRSSSSLTA